MQVQERMGLSTGISPSMPPPNKKDKEKMPHERFGSAIPLVRSQTDPHGQLSHRLRKPDPPPQIEQSYSDSVNDTNHSHNSHHSTNIDVNWPQPTTALPTPQSRQDPSDPDSQEQALFEQRLCEDIYGVAVRKINQNGKSNLRYIKCLYVNASEVLNFDEPNSNAQQHYSSNRSVSSRHSRGSRVSLRRMLGGGSSHKNSHAILFDNDAHRSLLREIENNDSSNHSSSSRNGKIRVLSWGKKKDVTVPLVMFTAVKKGKVNYRSRRNPCDSSRILSLVTSDIHPTNERQNNNSISLDIEAPTRLDRDKFAKAFARFLNVPLIEEDDSIKIPQSQQQHQQPQVSTAFPHQHSNHRPLPSHQAGADGNRSIARSIKSDATPQSWKEPNRQSISSSVNNDHSIPDIALITSNSQTTNEKGANHTRSSSWKQLKAPLPIVTTRGTSALGKNSATKPPRNNRRSTSNGSKGVVAPLIHPAIVASINANSKSKIHTINLTNSSSSSHNGSEAEDPPLASLPSSSHSRGASHKISTGLSHNIINTSSPKPMQSPPTNRKMVLEIPNTTKSKLSKHSTSNHDRGTPATSAISAHVPTHSTALDTPATKNNDGDGNENSDNINANNISRDAATDDSIGGSVVSSITGVGFDQDLVEELHLALEQMKVELEESRAEASRAVKVAEQAIQSAENSNSNDWNNTVTHKAAEAAATAQKRSAEAMAKARVAEERLEKERKNSTQRKKQVEKAEHQAAHWQTRAAAAEVQRFAVAEALESERKKNEDLEKRFGVTEALESELKKNQDLVLRAEQVVTGSARMDGFIGDGKSSSPSRSRTATEFSEINRLRSKLAMESARRRKLLDELQDLRGSIRVYCRLKAHSTITHKNPDVIDVISNEVLMLHRNRSSASQQNNKSIGNDGATPLCFEFDGILSSDMDQQDVYAEFEAICSSVVEGFKICIMSYGQANSRKTHTMLGDIVYNDKNHSVSIENNGIHLRAMKQLFSLLEHRKDRFQDTITMNLVEVHDEKLIDLLAGTDFGEQNGKVETRRSSRRSTAEDETPSPSRKSSELKPKLEIKTNRDGETVVRGVLSVGLASFDDVLRVWSESLGKRSGRLAGKTTGDRMAYERNSHIVVTMKITSKNLTTGSTAYGRMQFVDFASSEIMPKKAPGTTSPKKLYPLGSPSEQLTEDWKFTNKSLNTVREVVLARSQYQRSVPYRNSTITHILSDSLEADTKVVFIACVNSDEDDLSNTASTLRLAQEMRKVVVGKATRHTATASIFGGSIHRKI